MTPAQVEEAARRRYNAVGDTFWSQDELFKILYEAEQQLATEALVIEAKDTSIATVSGTRSYAYPSLFIAIKRIECNGIKLKPIEFREDDTITLNNSATTQTGQPQFYTIWNDQILLRPIPDAVYTLTIYGHKEAALLTTASSTLSVPVRCHSSLINYAASMIAAKDENWTMSQKFMDMWMADVARHRAWTAKKKRTDGFAVVKDEASLAETFLGSV